MTMPPLRPTRNILAGFMFMAFGLFGLWLARDLDAGTASDMGPGYFPRLVCIVLVLLGAALSATDLVRQGDPSEGWAWRPFWLITLSALAFAFLLKPVGLVGTIAITTVLASAAASMLRPLPLAVLVAVLIAVNVGIFVLLLRMPIPLWPTVL
jgi:Tripartite tricarboxylate transporter TctB family